VIALVGYHLFHSLLSDFARRCLRHFQRLVDRGRITLIGRLQRHRQQRSARQIHGMLGFVRQMRAPILHPGDPRIRVTGTLPFLVGPLLLPLPVQPHQLFPRRILHPRRFPQLLQILVVALPVIPPHDALQGRIGFQKAKCVILQHHDFLATDSIAESRTRHHAREIRRHHDSGLPSVRVQGQETEDRAELRRAQPRRYPLAQCPPRPPLLRRK